MRIIFAHKKTSNAIKIYGVAPAFRSKAKPFFLSLHFGAGFRLEIAKIYPQCRTDFFWIGCTVPIGETNVRNKNISPDNWVAKLGAKRSLGGNHSCRQKDAKRNKNWRFRGGFESPGKVTHRHEKTGRNSWRRTFEILQLARARFHARRRG